MKAIHKFLSAVIPGLTAFKIKAGYVGPPIREISWALIFSISVILILYKVIKSSLGKKATKKHIWYYFLCSFLIVLSSFYIAIKFTWKDLLSSNSKYAGTIIPLLLPAIFILVMQSISWWLLFKKEKKLMRSLIIYSITLVASILLILLIVPLFL